MGELGPEDGSGNTYSLRPGFHRRFKSSTVKECIHAILKEKLANVQYVPEEMPQLTQSLSETIKDRLKEEGFDRYKMVVQVVIGEQRGEGVKSSQVNSVGDGSTLSPFSSMAARCFWDADTDSYAHDVYMNDSLFCVVAAFGCFYY
ncbi:dynein light chain Tctex-type protein 2B isoform X1 [Heliangelus exortis]|uniref:dynein light chain Tctex-type protein 2B isoform X1 n=1 Tax=Heliangelus exortis TaxID=472823 RepID=UPI003A8E08DE